MACFSLKQISLLSLLTCTLICSFAKAESNQCCNVPTIWTFKNSSKKPIILSCKLISSTVWDEKQKPISIDSLTVASDSSVTHDWGPNWNSDGLGLIPGNWTCSVNSEDQSKKGDLNFATNWGENVNIEWQGATLNLAISPSKAKPETKKQ